MLDRHLMTARTPHPTVRAVPDVRLVRHLSQREPARAHSPTAAVQQSIHAAMAPVMLKPHSAALSNVERLSPALLLQVAGGTEAGVAYHGNAA